MIVTIPFQLMLIKLRLENFDFKSFISFKHIINSIDWLKWNI